MSLGHPHNAAAAVERARARREAAAAAAAQQRSSVQSDQPTRGSAAGGGGLYVSLVDNGGLHDDDEARCVPCEPAAGDKETAGARANATANDLELQVGRACWFPTPVQRVAP